MEWHRPRVDALLKAGVDLLAFDTIPSLVEARAVVSLLQEYPNAQAWISFSCKVTSVLVASSSKGKVIHHRTPFQLARSHSLRLKQNFLGNPRMQKNS